MSDHTECERKSALLPHVSSRAHAKRLDVAGIPAWVLLSAEQTGGRFSLFELLCPPGQGTPPHAHAREDETFYILEGRIDITVGGVTHELGPGSAAFGPRGIPHSFTNPGPGDARFLVTTTPGGFERFFEEVHEKLPATKPLDMPLFLDIIRRHGMTVG